MNYDTEI